MVLLRLIFLVLFAAKAHGQVPRTCDSPFFPYSFCWPPWTSAPRNSTLVFSLRAISDPQFSASLPIVKFIFFYTYRSESIFRFILHSSISAFSPFPG
jgi:hypothetical protein